MGHSRMPSLAELSSRKYVGLHFLEVSGFFPEGLAGRPAMMMRMTTKICYIIQWQGVGALLSGAVPSRITPGRQLCHDICSFRWTATKGKKNSFSEVFFDLWEQLFFLHFWSSCSKIYNRIFETSLTLSGGILLSINMVQQNVAIFALS